MSESKMGAPHISVVTSCYNSVRYLKEAIESILAQTFTDFEFILINDGSKDHTFDIIRKYASKDARIVVIDKENTGLTDSLNVGINRARGKWIARMDDDDISLPDRLEKQVQVVSGADDIILLGSGCITIDEKGREIKEYTYPAKHETFISNVERGHSTFPHSSTLFRSDIVKLLNGYRKRMNGSEDLDLWLRMSALGRISCINKPLLKLRKHAASITAKNDRLLILSTACIISHLMRTNGYSDPVDSSEEDYRDYLAWIEKRLIEENAFEVQRLLSDLRKVYSSGSPDIKPFRLAISLMRSPYKYDLIRHRFFRPKHYRTLAFEWATR